ncbi:hypothetical protein GF357_03400 [Candidatus Dojkabacteria bacterium]|nr:hypothetical protein [Candidatus Dojkabacteria bacterium]
MSNFISYMLSYINNTYYITITCLHAITRLNCLKSYSISCCLKRRKSIIIASNQNSKKLHAEEQAILSCDNLSQSTLFVTVPPCLNRHNSLSCTDLIINNNIKKLVLLFKEDFNPRVGDKSVKLLKKNGVEVIILFAPLLKLLYITRNLYQIIQFKKKYGK